MKPRARHLVERLLGLRGRLMVLASLSLGPALLLVAYLGWKQGVHAEQKAIEHVAHIARTVALEYETTLERGRHAVAALASLAEIRGDDFTACTRALIGPREMERAIIGLGVADRAGRLLCAAPGTPSLRAEDLLVLRVAQDQEGIAQGEYGFHAELRRAMVTLTLLLPPRAGAEDRVLFVQLDPLERMAQLARTAALPEGAVIALVDGQRRVLLRYPDRERFSGQIAPQTGPAPWLAGTGEEAPGFDGLLRLWAIEPVGKPGATGQVLAQVGLPSAAITAPVQRDSRNAYLALSMAAIGLLLLSWFLGGRLLVRPIRQLARMAHSIADGDVSLRTGLQGMAGEIGELARSFDSMAKRVEEQFEALNAARRVAKRSEKMFRAVADLATSGILLSLNGRVIYLNHAAEVFSGYRRDELQSMSFWEIAHPDFQEQLRSQSARRLRGEPVDGVAEFRLNTRDGRECWVGSAGARIVLDDQVGEVITWWDISERRRLEQHARANEATLRSVMDQLVAAVFVHRGDKLLYVNNATIEATGKTREALLQMHFADLFAPEDRIMIHERALARLRGESPPNHYEARMQRPDGRLRWVEVVGSVIEYQGETAVLGSCYDITERRRASEMVTQILQGSPSPTFVLDEQHRVAYWNAACESAFDTSAQEIIGTRDQWQPFYAERRPVLADIILSGAAEEEGAAFYAGKKLRQSTFAPNAYEAEDFFPQFGSRGMWLHFTAAPLRDSQGHLIGAIETLQDVTDRRFAEEETRQAKSHLEEQVQKRTAQLAKAKETLEIDNQRRQDVERVLRQQNDALTELNRKLTQAQEQLLQSEKLASIGQLAAGVAHEINNPIGYVHSNLGSLGNYLKDLFALIDAAETLVSDLPEGDRLRQGLLSLREQYDLAFLKEDLPALLEESKEGITRVKKIVQDLKDFSRVDNSQEWQMADLHAGIDSTLNIVRNEIKYKAEVVKEYGHLPPVECLPSQLNQVFMNLLVNAAHAMKDQDRGTIWIRTGTQSEQEVWVEVADDGCGISPENLKRIFDPFFTTKPVGKGTGLGLSLAYGIVQKHGGRIEVDSVVGQGTRFRVSLPVHRSEQAATKAEQAA